MIQQRKSVCLYIILNHTQYFLIDCSTIQKAENNLESIYATECASVCPWHCYTLLFYSIKGGASMINA
jgi:hypothetical protein